MKLLSLIRSPASALAETAGPEEPDRAPSSQEQSVAEIARIAVAGLSETVRGPSKLVKLIRGKAASPPPATAISAIPATASPTEKRSVAEVAGIAVAAAPDANRSLNDGDQDKPQVVDPSDLRDDYLERLAICGEAGDVAANEAHRIATDQCGFSLDELVARQVQYWRFRLLQLDEPNNRRLKEVVPHCLAALDQPWLRHAIGLGWDARALFGLDPAAPSVFSRNGLVTGLILSSLKHPLEVLKVATDQAVIETGTGSRLRHFNTGRAGPPVWDHAAFRTLH